MILLLFFVGMEVSVPKLAENWRVPILGVIAQIGLSLLAMAGLGWALAWPIERIVLLGFVISLSSTAVVVSLLRSWGEMESEVGQDALGILLAQDLAIVPMLIILSAMAPAGSISLWQIALQVGGGVLFLGFVAYIVKRGSFSLPLASWFRNDHDMQVFAAFLICFGFATLSALFQLSTALGAFIAGIVVATAKETHWVHHSLEPMRVLFVAFFFTAIGMVIDLNFFAEHWLALVLATLAALVLNTALNAAVLRALKRSWRASLFGGAILAQIGEFSFVLAAAGLQAQLVTQYAYQMTVGVIALSIMFSALWIGMMRSWIHAE